MIFDLEWIIFASLLGASFFAGLVDAMVGGGGLIQLPALFGLLPNTNHAVILGTNKLSSIVGTASAMVKYARRVQVPWNAVIPASITALPGTLLGAWLITGLPKELVLMFLPILLTAVAIYTFSKKDLGLVHSPRRSRSGERLIGAALGFVIGFYDGFFGPGTGSFLMLSLVVLFGFDFLAATAGAKIVNVVCNLSALLWFAPNGYVLWSLGLSMAVLNLAGSQVGTLLAIKKGSGFVRVAFLWVVCFLILKTAWDAYSSYVYSSLS